MNSDGRDTVTSSRHRTPQAVHTLPEMQRRWNLWLHSDVTVASPRPMEPWQTEHVDHDDCAAGGTGASQKGLDDAGVGPDRLPPPKAGVENREGLVVANDDDPNAGDVLNRVELPKGLGVAGGCVPNRLVPIPKDGSGGGDDPNSEELDVAEDDDPNATGDPKEEELGVVCGNDPNKVVRKSGVEEHLKELAVDVACCPNQWPAKVGWGETEGAEAKEKGVAAAGAVATAGVSLHCALHAGQAPLPETHRRWNVWAHSDLNAACQRPTSQPQASHRARVLLSMISQA